MGKSVQKSNYLKDRGSYKNFMKKLSHSRVRLETKRRLKKEEWDLMPLNKEMTNQWDICDWKIFYTNDNMRGWHQYAKENERVPCTWETWTYYYVHFYWTPRSKWYKSKYCLLK